MNWGMKVLQTFALPLGYGTNIGAGDEARTRYLHLGKVALYQMSYTCAAAKTYLCPPNAFYAGFLNRCPADTRGIRRDLWCLRPESNQRHGDFQSPALPTELQRHMATVNGLEPSTSSVTG